MNTNQNVLGQVLVFGGIAAVVAFSILDPQKSGRAPTKLIVGAVIGGAFAGNYLWDLVFSKEA